MIIYLKLCNNIQVLYLTLASEEVYETSNKKTSNFALLYFVYEA